MASHLHSNKFLKGGVLLKKIPGESVWKFMLILSIPIAGLKPAYVHTHVMYVRMFMTTLTQIYMYTCVPVCRYVDEFVSSICA